MQGPERITNSGTCRLSDVDGTGPTRYGGRWRDTYSGTEQGLAESPVGLNGRVEGARRTRPGPLAQRALASRGWEGWIQNVSITESKSSSKS